MVNMCDKCGGGFQDGASIFQDRESAKEWTIMHLYNNPKPIFNPNPITLQCHSYKNITHYSLETML